MRNLALSCTFRLDKGCHLNIVGRRASACMDMNLCCCFLPATRHWPASLLLARQLIITNQPGSGGNSPELAGLEDRLRGGGLNRRSSARTQVVICWLANTRDYLLSQAREGEREGESGKVQRGRLKEGPLLRRGSLAACALAQQLELVNCELQSSSVSSSTPASVNKMPVCNENYY